MAVTLPTAYWKFDESSGDAVDSVGSLNAVNTSVTYSAQKLNNGAVYNGSAFHTVSDNSAIKPTSDISFGGWIYINSTATSYQMFIAKGENAGDTRSYEMRQFSTTSQIEIQMKVAGNYVQARTTAGIGTGVWKHVIFTRTGTTQAIYVDGVSVGLAANVTQSGNIDYSTDALWFGQRNGGLRLNGRLDEIGIWNVALTASEVKALYNDSVGKAYPFSAVFKKATVNASMVPATQTNMPAYVDLSRIGITTLTEAKSVRVYADSAKTTEWAREIVSATEMHVKVPLLTSTVEMFVDWDGVRADYAVTDTYGRNAVWSDYIIVSHQDDTENATGGTDFTNSGVTFTSTSGKIGNYGDYVSSSSDNMYIADAATYKPTTVTVQSWVYLSSIANGTYPRILDRMDTTANTGWRLFIGKDGSSSPYPIFDFSNAGGFQRAAGSAGSISTGAWTMLHGTYDASTAGYIYINATQSGSDTTSGNITYSTAADVALGVNKTGTTFYLNGRIDEARLRSGALSQNWITTEYNNQSDEAGFWGTWSTVGGATFTPRVSFIM